MTAHILILPLSAKDLTCLRQNAWRPHIGASASTYVSASVGKQQKVRPLEHQQLCQLSKASMSEVKKMNKFICKVKRLWIKTWRVSVTNGTKGYFQDRTQASFIISQFAYVEPTMPVRPQVPRLPSFPQGPWYVCQRSMIRASHQGHFSQSMRLVWYL